MDRSSFGIEEDNFNMHAIKDIILDILCIYGKLFSVMKRTLFFIFALVALAGILNCVLIEPAFAYKEETAHSEESGDSDCCFIHCSMHHQWATSSSATLFHNVSVTAFIPSSFTLHHDSPTGSIFHPPLAF